MGRQRMVMLDTKQTMTLKPSYAAFVLCAMSFIVLSCVPKPEDASRALRVGFGVRSTIRKGPCAHIPQTSSLVTTRPSRMLRPLNVILEKFDDPVELIERKKYQTKRDEFLLNKGKLVDTLRADIPQMLDKAPSESVLRDDVRLHLQFGNVGLDFEVQGKEQYQTWFASLRWTSRVTFGWVEVTPIKIAPDVDPNSLTVKGRWSVIAYPRLFTQNGPVRIDLMSVFELDSQGKVMKHVITDVDSSSVKLPEALRSLLVPSPSLLVGPTAY